MPEKDFQNSCMLLAAFGGAMWGVYNQESLLTIAMYAVASGGVVATMFYLIDVLEKIYQNVPPEE